MTTPLVPSDCDLRDFPFMPVDIIRLFGSEFHTRASDAEWRAGVTLWLKSFHQVPAASLPNDDASLAMLAELGRDVKSWRKVRGGALRGWVLCEDGRFYHKVVAEKALEAWIEKLQQRKVSALGNAKKYNLTFDPAPLDTAIDRSRALLTALNPQSRTLKRRSHTPSRVPPDGSPGGNPEDIPLGSQETGTETGTEIIANEQQPPCTPAAAAPFEIHDLERRCREVTGWTETDGISAIVDLIQAGFDLDERILPLMRAQARMLRDRGKPPPGVWAFMAKIVRDPTRRPVAASDGQVEIYRRVTVDDPRWPSLADQWAEDHGGKQPPRIDMQFPDRYFAKLSRIA